MIPIVWMHELVALSAVAIGIVSPNSRGVPGALASAALPAAVVTFSAFAIASS
jgi:hypothetical protein